MKSPDLKHLLRRSDSAQKQMAMLPDPQVDVLKLMFKKSEPSKPVNGKVGSKTNDKR